MSFRSWIVFGAIAACILFYLHVESVAANTLQNGSFNDVRRNMPSEWHLNEPVKDRGSASVEGGDRVLVLRPNSKNTDPSSAFGVVQFFPADGYRGQRVPLSVTLRAEGGATASAMALAFDNRDRITETAQILEQGSNMERKTTSINVPQNAQTVMIALSVTGPRGAAYFDDVAFAPGADSVEVSSAPPPPSVGTGGRGSRRTSRSTPPSPESVTTQPTSDSFGVVWTPLMDEPLRGGPCMSWRCVGVGDPTIARAPD